MFGGSSTSGERTAVARGRAMPLIAERRWDVVASSTQSASGATRHEVIEKGEYDLVMGYLEEIARFPALTDADAMQLGRDKEAGERVEWYREDWSKLSEAER